MTETKSSRDQLREWVGQLAPEHRRELLEVLAEDEQLIRAARHEMAVEQLRRLCAERGYDWEAMSQTERDAFLEHLLQEDLGATNVGPPPMLGSKPPACPHCGRDLGPTDLYRIYFGSRRPGAQQAPATLVVVGAQTPDAQFPLNTSGEINIGRIDPHRGIRPEIDLSRFDMAARVSRRHARIIARDGEFYIEDLGSSNGTVLNGRTRLAPQTPVRLNPGDTIRIGQTVLKFTTR